MWKLGFLHGFLLQKKINSKEGNKSISLHVITESTLVLWCHLQITKFLDSSTCHHLYFRLLYFWETISLWQSLVSLYVITESTLVLWCHLRITKYLDSATCHHIYFRFLYFCELISLWQSMAKSLYTRLNPILPVNHTWSIMQIIKFLDSSTCHHIYFRFLYFCEIISLWQSMAKGLYTRLNPILPVNHTWSIMQIIKFLDSSTCHHIYFRFLYFCEIISLWQSMAKSLYTRLNPILPVNHTWSIMQIIKFLDSSTCHHIYFRLLYFWEIVFLWQKVYIECSSLVMIFPVKHTWSMTQRMTI